MTDIELDRAAVLRHRVDAQQIGREAPGPDSCRVLGPGVRDNPVGVTAPLALRARGIDALGEDAALVRVYSVRSALHVHRRADLGPLRAALRWSVGDEPAEQTYGRMRAGLDEEGLDLRSTVDSVVTAMRAVTSDSVPRTKGELSAAVTGLVDPAEAPWCPSCATHHVNDGLFRHATLLAGLVAVSGERRSFRLQPVAVEPDEPDSARSELLRRYVHLAGTATPAQFATWAGMHRQAVKRCWGLLEDELSPVRIGDTRMSALTADLELLTRPVSDDPGAVRLLPAYDPYTELADRVQLVPDPGHRRKVWRAVRNPGVVLRDGEIAGVWRDRRAGSGRSVTIEPFGTLGAADRRAAADSAEYLLTPGPVSVDFT